MREEGLEVTAPCRVARGVPPRRVEAVVEKVWSIMQASFLDVQKKLKAEKTRKNSKLKLKTRKFGIFL